MALHYFIDGYNLIWSTNQFGVSRAADGRLQDQREKLLKFLERARPAGSVRNTVTVVFDGKDDVDSPSWKGTVRVMFSKGTNADALIKRCVDEMSNPRDAVVVTNDRDIQKWVRASKAKVLSCEEFLAGAAKKKEAPPPASGPKGAPDPGTATDINNEFRRIWKLD